MSVTVRVPATTANIGPGFDCLGAALTLYNQFTFSELPVDSSHELEITVKGVDEHRVSRDADNMVVQAMETFYRKLNQPIPKLKIDIEMNVPLARGLGSSATAIVGGLVGANELAGQPLSRQQIADLATEIEGHPDNVVPALLGGCRLSASGIDRDWEVSELSWHASIIAIVAIPAFELSTAAARQVLPATYSRSDVVFNMAHLGLLMQGLSTGNPDWLKAALQDKVHQPYRKALIPNFDSVEAAAIAAGAHGVVISGAGPTLLALSNLPSAQNVAQAMKQTWESVGIETLAIVLQLDTDGVKISS
ncbi:MAG: homoserine kinase [Cyanobacteria bacterium]|nr:homoserine kinase [Cyanobacteriota bacterium]